MQAPGLREIHQRIYQILMQRRAGITINELRHELGLGPTEQQHLDRRIRDLDDYYIIRRERRGRETLYFLEGPNPNPPDRGGVSKTLRAEVLHLAAGRCQMCGRTVAEDKVRLHIDHKIPREWGGPTELENLWALCSECNEGKRNFFASFTDPRIQRAMLHRSVHIRLGELLKAFHNEWVAKEYLAVVAWTHDDWEKRLRELREIGWDYNYKRQQEGDRVRVYFRLARWAPWPDDPAKAIREAELRKGKKR
jgi:hypothetical protein